MRIDLDTLAVLREGAYPEVTVQAVCWGGLRRKTLHVVCGAQLWRDCATGKTVPDRIGDLLRVGLQHHQEDQAAERQEAGGE